MKLKISTLLRRILLVKIFVLLFFSGWAQEKRFVFTQPKMGSPFTIILYAPDSTAAGRLSRECFFLVDSLAGIFSDYIDSSELNRLCARAGTPARVMSVSKPLLDILQEAKKAHAQSSGSFDITLGPLTKLWRQARKEQVFPSKLAVQEKLALAGIDKMRLDTAAGTAELVQAGMQLDLGGIAQGYIAQAVIDHLRFQGVTNALVDVSGDVSAIGAPPGKAGWTIGINVPGDGDQLLPRLLSISNNTVTTSGDVYQYMQHNGKRYSHIIDPRTGYGTTNGRNVTVIASNGTLADWLTKAGSLLPVKKAKKLAARLGAEILVVENKDGKLRMYASKGVKKFFTDPSASN